MWECRCRWDVREWVRNCVGARSERMKAFVNESFVDTDLGLKLLENV